MDNLQSAYIKTEHPGKGNGITIKQTLYLEIVNFIVSNVRASDKVSLPILLTRSSSKFRNISDIQSYINYVKLDLEAKGLIRMVTVASINMVCVHLTALGLKIFDA